MHPSALFIRRPVATSLLSFALLLAGAVAYKLLPVASLPQVKIIQQFQLLQIFQGLIRKQWPRPLPSRSSGEFGHIAGVTEIDRQ